MDFISANNIEPGKLLPDCRFYPGIRRYNLQEFAESKTVNQEMYIDILRRVRDAQNKTPRKMQNKKVGFSFTTVLQHTGRFRSRIS